MRRTVEAPAKVNLFLRVLAREDSGYHQIETLFCALDLADTLDVDVEAGPGIEVAVEGAELGPPEENLVHRAARAFYDAAGLEPRVRFALRKNVPHGAGLGGGSSDAAAALHALDALHGAPLGQVALLAIAARLGSDVAFFLCGSPLALAWGRGERLLALPPLAARPALVVAPAFASPTATAYRELAERRKQAWMRPGNGAILETGGDPAAPAPRVLSTDALGDWDAVADAAENDFEAVLFPRFPQLAAIRAALAEAGARPALLSGSGSSLFGVFDDPAERDAATTALRSRFPDARVLETATRESVFG